MVRLFIKDIPSYKEQRHKFSIEESSVWSVIVLACGIGDFLYVHDGCRRWWKESCNEEIPRSLCAGIEGQLPGLASGTNAQLPSHSFTIPDRKYYPSLRSIRNCWHAFHSPSFRLSVLPGRRTCPSRPVHPTSKHKSYTHLPTYELTMHSWSWTLAWIWNWRFDKPMSDWLRSIPWIWRWLGGVRVGILFVCTMRMIIFDLYQYGNVDTGFEYLRAICGSRLWCEKEHSAVKIIVEPLMTLSVLGRCSEWRRTNANEQQSTVVRPLYTFWLTI